MSYVPRGGFASASQGFSYLTPHESLGYDGYSSLPRMHNGQQRRKLVNTAVQDYFMSLNSMTRSIVLETESVEKKHECEWIEMNEAKKEEVMNDHFVPEDIRMHYSEIERAASCCSFATTTSWNSPLHSNSFVIENRPLHLSQPNDWEDWPGYGSNGGRGYNSQLSRSSNDLVFKNEYPNKVEDLSLSQPLRYEPPTTDPQANYQPFNRLHKKQLSLRSNHKVHQSRTLAPTRQHGRPRDTLGSDGEGTRTSDEDFDPMYRNSNPLAFQRNRLRSYSMRSRKVPGGINTNSMRASVRTSHRLRQDNNPSSSSHTDSSRPSHYHSYSNTSTEPDTDFDGEIDLPDEALLLDHVYTDSDSTVTSTPPKPQRYSRQRRSVRGADLKPTAIVIHNTSSSDDTYTDSAISSDEKSVEVLANRGLLRAPSRESLDSVSTTSKSHIQSDDEVLSVSEQSRMTPDSVLSSTSFSRPRSKTGEMAIMRNRRGKRGGSSYKMVTSDFADRHTQFKSNMFVKKQLESAQSSASTTRAPTPLDITDQHDTGYLKPPALTISCLKHNSMSESITCSDFPRSPDHMSQVCSPPITPLAISHTAANKMLASYDENRESGYLSSSSESFHNTFYLQTKLPHDD